MRREDKNIRSTRDVTQPRAKPNQQWVCGYAELGQCCRCGPTRDGRCGRTVDDASQGLAGDEPPNEQEVVACIPRRSQAARRQSLRINLAILTGGLLMLCMALPSREQVFVPGELSSTHAQILDNTVAADRCSLCHPTSHSSEDSAGGQFFGGLLSSAKRLIENDGRQDELCMRCHQGHMPEAATRDPHDLSPEMWRELNKEGESPWQLVSTRNREAMASETLTSQSSEHAERLQKTSCAMCHTEHHGRDSDIKLISDSRCQACHKRQFESLASGHPEFVNFPMDRPRGLAFSHSEHTTKHFPKKNREFDCKACHLTSGQTGSVDLIARSLSFEHACASCHEGPIRAATVDGWATIQLPSIEAQDTTAGGDFSHWPGAAQYGYDGQVSPVMRALLMADPEATSALEKLPASGKLVDISTISSSRARVAKSLAMATRRLLDETAREGQAAWIARLEQVTRSHLDRELTEHDQQLIKRMAAGLPPDLFRHAQSQWFGHESLAHVTSNGPTLSGKTLAPVLEGTFPALSLAAASTKAKTSKPPTDSLESALQQHSSDDLLAPATSTSTAPNNSDDLLLGTTDLATEKTSTKPAPKLVKGATHLTGGGWYADQSTLSIRYMPTGHADATLAAWTLWWSMMESHRSVLPNGDAQRIAQKLNLSAATDAVLQNQSLADTIPGHCAQCHQLQNSQPALSLISARPSSADAKTLSVFHVPERNPAAREFTKFNHTAHLTLPALSDCRYCHKEKSSQPLVQPASLMPNLTSPHPMTREFASMNVSQCSACHRPGGANDRCVQCHNYHVKSFFDHKPAP